MINTLNPTRLMALLAIGVIVSAGPAGCSSTAEDGGTKAGAVKGIGVVTPATLGGKPRVKLAGQADHNAPGVVDATYGDFGSKDLTFAVALASTKAVEAKEKNFASSLKQIYGVQTLTEAPAGPMGGKASCGQGKDTSVVAGETVIGCLWADDVSAGYVVRTKVSAETAASEFAALRAEIETSGSSTAALPAAAAPVAQSPEVATAVSGTTGAATPAVEATVGATAGGSVPECKDADLKVVLTAQNRFLAGATVRALVQATNVSNHTCRITGWIGVSLVDASGAAKAVSAQEVDQPGPPVAVDVDPGEYAPAGIKWTQCDSGAGSCLTGNTVEVALPGGKPRVATLKDFPPVERSGIAFSELQIGTFQPTRIGVVAW